MIDDLGRQTSELIGAIGFYLGDLGSTHKGDKARLRRAMQRAMRSPAFVEYMQASETQSDKAEAKTDGE